MSRRLSLIVCSLCMCHLGDGPRAVAEDTFAWRAGFARVDVTPTEPVRMSGYGSRDRPSEGIDTPLYVRSLALHQRSSPHASVLISIDAIGVPGDFTRRIAETTQQRHGIPRENLAFCATHTHAGPHFGDQLSSLFAVEMSEDEVAAADRYRDRLESAILDAIRRALDGLQPARVAYGIGEAEFAANRRVLTDGRWTGFGVQPDGPVDHTVPVLRVTDSNDQILGIVFNYACHCTTLGGEHYRINADWAGYAATQLESAYPESVAMCTIGCGADANPSPRGTVEAATIHGRTLAAAVRKVLDGDMAGVDAALQTRFDYAALTFDLPTQEELTSRVGSSNPQAGRHAERLLGVLKEHGRLPATYPVPIQSWQFGDQLTMVFLGGEVVVDYALRLKETLEDPNLWVTAYANDVLGYIASERMRMEGGYEYDRSGVYYGLPGPWASGSEDLLVDRVLKMLQSRGRWRPGNAEQSLQMMKVADGFQIELIAAEPLVRDPINIAFDASGQLWVVEMGDYPEGENGGRVKRLTDNDGDGVFDTATDFLTGLPYPTGAMPWRDGVLVSAAPDVLFARDTDGDGTADQVHTLYEGFRLANPQHRVNGFTYGLDHSLHLASGDNLSEVTSVATGERVDASGHDVQIWPDSGRVGVTSGRTQYVRSRNDWGQWFGNDNSRPMYHFPIDDAYLRRNSAVNYSGGNQQLFDPPVAPPVFPLTSATERFNDLFAANRFTSACSAVIVRTPAFEPSPGKDAALICEPVHNLVHRSVLEPDGATYRATRSSAEGSSEFLASSDPWFRPVRALVGPDGMLYVVDMYRETIEHPEWIPESWQQQLDLRAGEDRGRIYRVSPVDAKRVAIDLGTQSVDELIAELKSPVGPRRDMAQQLLLQRADEVNAATLRSLVTEGDSPRAIVHALSMLDVMGKLDDETLLAGLRHRHPGVLVIAIRICESRLTADSDTDWVKPLSATAEHDDSQVVLQSALALGQVPDPSAAKVLAGIVRRASGDPWIHRAVSSSAATHAEGILAELFPKDEPGLSDFPLTLVRELLKTAGDGGVDVASKYGHILENPKVELPTRFRLAAGFKQSLKGGASTEFLRSLYDRARDIVVDDAQDTDQRCEALRLVGIGIGSSEAEQSMLLDLLVPQTPVRVQQEAVDRLANLREVEACEALIARWPSMSKSLRDHCVSHMLRQRPWADALLRGLESGQVRSADLTPAAKQQLAHTGSRSMRVRAERLTRATGSLQKRELVQKYLAGVKGKGDPDRGAEHFKQHCAVCHVANGQGQAVGASLNNLSDRGELALLTAILDPNRAVDPKFQSYVIQTDDDRILVGAIEEETGQSLTLAHADGKRSVVSRDEIAAMKNAGVSLMPEGLEGVLSLEQMNDLIRYLQVTPAPGQ